MNFIRIILFINYNTDILVMHSINDTASNTTISIINSTDVERNHSSTSGSNKAFHILIQLQQLQIQELESKEETTSKSIHFFPGIILFLLYFLLM